MTKSAGVQKFYELWTDEDATNASLQGWNIFHCDGQDDELQIQFVQDEDALFQGDVPRFTLEGDKQAVQFCRETAIHCGNTTAQKAFACLEYVHNLNITNPGSGVKVGEFDLHKDGSDAFIANSKFNESTCENKTLLRKLLALRSDMDIRSEVETTETSIDMG